MHKYEEFINEEFTAKQNVYQKAMADYFFANGLSTNITYDLQGYMVVNAKFNIRDNKTFVENIGKTIKMMEFIKKMNDISVQVFSGVGKTVWDITMNYTFDFRDMNNIDPFLASLIGISKYKL